MKEPVSELTWKLQIMDRLWSSWSSALCIVPTQLKVSKESQAFAYMLQIHKKF